MIYHPDTDFNFTDLTLTNPNGIQGGAYFSKLNMETSNDLILQLNPCSTKQGIVKNDKHVYCDFVCDISDPQILWFEKLTEKVHALIYEKKDIWFTTEINMTDIENNFISPIKPFQAGKKMIIRSFSTSPCNISAGCFNESGSPIDSSFIQQTTKVIPLIEILGLKFTSKYFQLIINFKQIMVLNDVIKFNECVIKPSTAPRQVGADEYDSCPDKEKSADDPISNEESMETKENEDDEDLTRNDVQNHNTKSQAGISNHLEEIDVAPSDDNEEIKLKPANEVYMKIFEEAKNIADKKRKEAIAAYLEAMNIKKTYMLEISDEEMDENNYERFLHTNKL